MKSELEILRQFVRLVAAIADPTARAEDDIDALYQTEGRFADVISEARFLVADLGLNSAGKQ